MKKYWLGTKQVWTLLGSKIASLTDLENLPEPQILATSIIENLEEALLTFRGVEEGLPEARQFD